MHHKWDQDGKSQHGRNGVQRPLVAPIGLSHVCDQQRPESGFSLEWISSGLPVNLEEPKNSFVPGSHFNEKPTFHPGGSELRFEFANPTSLASLGRLLLPVEFRYNELAEFDRTGRKVPMVDPSYA